ncbi:MAG: inorganic diphosphatase [Candidatus Paceibacterota bacterium]|jgi:inorganic pyrophosphatase
MENYATKFIGKDVKIEIDRVINSKHPKHGFIYEVNYGFVPGTVAPDGEEIDAYLLMVGEPVESFRGKCVAVVHRLEEDDDKLVVIPNLNNISDKEILKMTNFQEKFFTVEIIRK